MEASSILWRRIDSPGHDGCRLERHARGWRLAGTAVFLHDAQPAQLAYEVTCHPDWRAREGRVHGWVGTRALQFHVVARTPDGAWTFNGAPVPGFDECADVDFGFTPATNLAQLRRVNLAIGQAADVPVAWLDVTSGQLEVLRQRYERRSEWTYWYEAPRFGYAALLEVTPAGFVRRYPGLWEAEPTR
jgi:uncharacterized protein